MKTFSLKEAEVTISVDRNNLIETLAGHDIGEFKPVDTAGGGKADRNCTAAFITANRGYMMRSAGRRALKAWS